MIEFWKFIGGWYKEGTELLPTVDHLAELIHPDAAVAWDRDIAPTSDKMRSIRLYQMSTAPFIPAPWEIYLNPMLAAPTHEKEWIGYRWDDQRLRWEQFM